LRTQDRSRALKNRTVVSPDAIDSAIPSSRPSESLSREERKKLRKHYIALAANQEQRDAADEVKSKSLPPRYSKAYLSLHLKAVHENFWIAHSIEMNPDHSPKSLAQLDDDLPESITKEAERKGYEFDNRTVWAFHAGLGSYFGEVLVRNLGGEWRYPNRLAVAFALLLNRPDILYRHWFVVVGKLKVRVFEIARRRETLGKERASLFKAYDEIAAAFRETHS